MNEIELQISQFIDNELSDNSQKKLFEVLVEDKNARQTISDYVQLKIGIALHHGSMTGILHPRPHLSKQVQSNIHPSNKYKTMFYFFAAATVVLAMLLFINRIERQNYLIQFASLQKKNASLKNESTKAINEKEAKNVTPTEPFFMATSKEKKLKSERTIFATKIQSAGNSVRLNRLAQISEIIQANKAVITKDDFIGGQIVGN